MEKSYYELSPHEALFAWAVSGLLTLTVIILVLDAITFVECVNQEYETPWYNANVLKAPVTHAALMFGDTTYQWAVDGTGQTQWLVKETKFGDKRFWTRLQSKPV